MTVLQRPVLTVLNVSFPYKLYFDRTDSMDSPDCLPILLSISVFLLFTFSFFPLCSCRFRAVD